jgi:plastocyanin
MPNVFPGQGASARLVAIVIGLLSLVAALGASHVSAPDVRGAEHAVQVAGFAFGPTTLTVSVGDTVTWSNADSAAHTVSAENGAFDSGNLDEGQAFSLTFDAPGTYIYRCDYHSEMTGTIVVQAAAATENAAPTSAASSPPAAGHQPDTALPAPASGNGPLAVLLIGLGLVALAVSVVPARVRARRPAGAGGWRR